MTKELTLKIINILKGVKRTPVIAEEIKRLEETIILTKKNKL